MKVIHNISVEAFMYPTEDQKRVRKALNLVLPLKAKLKREEMDSYYGPKIARLTYRADKAPEIREILQKIIGGLSKEERQEIAGTIEDRMDEEGNFHLRFSKQKAYAGQLALAYKGDVMKLSIKIASFPATLNNMKYNAKILFE